MWRFCPAYFQLAFKSHSKPRIPSRRSLGPDLPLHCLPSITSYSTNVSPTVPPENSSATPYRNVVEPPLSDSQRRTIYALSTPAGKAGIGVVRVSGPGALDVWRRMVKTTGGSIGREPRFWRMHRCRVVHPDSGETLDDGLAVFFKAPNSFTTEDVLELHIHSGRAVTSSVLHALSRLPFCRLAEAGEFTRRSFIGGRLDLTQVEGLKDLIDAETDCQRKIALQAARGETRLKFEGLRSEIIQCLAMVEALIDFGEGEDIEEGLYEQARERILDLRRTIQNLLSDNRRGEILRSGIRLAIFGPPNAGKSSLLNFLAQREAAIVTPVPGTTRDILELSLDIGGLPVIVSDTAGLRKTDDLVESIGVRKAEKTVQEADISLCVLSLPEVAETSGGSDIDVPNSVLPLVSSTTCFLFNKADLVSSRKTVVPPLAWTVSLITGEGTTEFMAGLAQTLQKKFNLLENQHDQTPLITRARHRVHLESALHFLDAFVATSAADIVLGAEELRYAAKAVGKVSGLIDVEDVLDAVFKEFCIGK